MTVRTLLAPLQPLGAAGFARLPALWRWLVRLAGAGLLAAMAGIHLHLYDLGYSTVPTVGWLFLVNVIAGSVAALAVLVAPGRWLAAVSLAGALLQIGTLGGLVLSLTVGLFGFDESMAAPLVVTTIAVEAAGFLVLAVPPAYDVVLILRRRRRKDLHAGLN